VMQRPFSFVYPGSKTEVGGKRVNHAPASCVAPLLRSRRKKEGLPVAWKRRGCRCRPKATGLRAPTPLRQRSRVPRWDRRTPGKTWSTIPYERNPAPHANAHMKRNKGCSKEQVLVKFGGAVSA